MYVVIFLRCLLRRTVGTVEYLFALQLSTSAGMLPLNFLKKTCQHTEERLHMSFVKDLFYCDVDNQISPLFIFSF